MNSVIPIIPIAATNPIDIQSLVQPDRVHKRVYTDPAIFELEMDRVFGQAWLYVGHESQVPNVGDYFTTRLGREPVVMVRHTDGAVNVLYNRCPHKGAKIVPDGSGSAGKFLRCLYHGWTFKCDGSLLSVPLRSGSKTRRSTSRAGRTRCARWRAWRATAASCSPACPKRGSNWPISSAAWPRRSTTSATVPPRAKWKWPAACSA